MAGSLNKSTEHWEQDRWDDHPAAFGQAMHFPAGAVTYVPDTAAKEEEHLNFFQKFLHFLAHPIKTLQGQSTMHGPGQGPEGASPPLGTHPDGAVGSGINSGSAFGVDRSHGQTPEAWWESRYADTDWSR